MNFIYNILLVVIILIFFPFILIGIIVNKKWRVDIFERFCIYKENVSFEGRKIIWFHAASVGEIQALIPILKELKNISNGYDFVVTTTSINGKKMINKELGNSLLFYCFLPVDLYFFTNYFLKRVDPVIVVFIETEFWPNLVNNIYERNVPLLLVNGRISEKSFKFYKIFSFIFSDMLNKFSLIVVQSEKMSKRFISIGGIDKQKIVILPNTKFSINQSIKDKYSIPVNKNKRMKEISQPNKV